MDYVDANKVGSHDPLDMTETPDCTITINDYVLAYKSAMSTNGQGNKHTMWEAHKPLDALDKIIHIMDTASRGSEDASTDDILTALAKVVALKTPPCVMLNAQDIVRLPKNSPGELLEPSVAERLAVVESQLRQLNDSASTNTQKTSAREG